MTATTPDLRRNLFKPGDRVSMKTCSDACCPPAHPSTIGTVQPYSTDAVTLEVVFDGETVAVVYYVEELHLLTLVEPAPAPETIDENAHAIKAVLGRARDELLANSTLVVPEPEAPAGPDYAASIYLAAVNLLMITEQLDPRLDATLNIGWDSYSGREVSVHLGGNATTVVDGYRLAEKLGLTEYKTKPYQGTIQHRWGGKRHDLPVEVVWIEHNAAPVETPS